MVKYAIKRIALAIFILFGVSVILYFLIRLMPVNYIENQYYASHQQADVEDAEEDLQRILEMYNLEDDSFVGICKGYFKWLSAFLRGDMGKSFKYNQPVEDIIFKNMGVSFVISFISLILQLIISIPLGIKSACNQYGKLDYTVTVLTMIGMSFPTFFFGSLFTGTGFGEALWMPIVGWAIVGVFAIVLAALIVKSNRQAKAEQRIKVKA